MAAKRNVVFVNDYYYHIFNRGIDRRTTFTNRREYARLKELLYFSQFNTIPLRYSQYQLLTEDRKQDLMSTMQKSGKRVEIVSYCLMSNHFHLLLKQKEEKGIQTFTANITNAYTKYFNTVHKRTGPLFQGNFKAVFVETEDQLLHLTRYIHLNPVLASIIEAANLPQYPWSSFPAFLGTRDELIDQQTFQDLSLPRDYFSFLKDQVDYAKNLAKIKHLTLE